jgi:cholesterol oxidase
VDRRSFLKAAGAAGVVAGAGGVAGVATAPAASAGAFEVATYRLMVPEIFTPVPDPPSHTQAVVIGSGFGAAVTMYRLARAGVQTTVLERGSRWPNDPQREIFSKDTLPDGRAFWHRTTFTGVTGLPVTFDDFGGVLDVTQFTNMTVWRGAAVGGGSVVYTGAHPIPEQRFFDAVFQGLPSYAEMVGTYYPRVKGILRMSPMPDDVYNDSSFSHSRTWDAQARKAGYTPQKIDGIWNWGVVRQEIAGQVRHSATVSESNYGNSNGAKFDLNQNYIKYAEATGKATVFPGHEVLSIGRDASGRYTITVKKTDPTGAILRTSTITCDQLYLGAGSIGTTELLMRARATGALPDLNEYIGTGWGTNGDAAVVRALTLGGITQGAPSASRIVDEAHGLPVTLENWYVPGLPLDLGLIGSLGMTLDPGRADFTWDTANNKLALDWPGQPDSVAAIRAVNNKIAQASGVGVGFEPFAKDVNDTFTAHPLGGAVLGRATDRYGRVKGYRGLYVMDGAAVPGSTATVNPSMTIAALAERNIENIIKNGG